MNMKKSLFGIALLIACACTDKKPADCIIEENQVSPEVKNGKVENVLYVHKLGVCDSFLVVTCQMEEPVVHVFDRYDFRPKGSFGAMGQAPSDLNMPFFLHGNHSDSLQLYDVSLAAFKHIDIRGAVRKESNAITQSSMPEQIIGSPNLYKGKEAYFGNMDGGPGLFFIYHPANNEMTWVDIPASVKNEESDFSVINYISVNEEQEKVVSAMCYYNKVFLYSTHGELIKERQIGEQEIAPMLTNDNMLSEESLRCCTDIQSTSGYIYLLMQHIKEKDFEKTDIENSRIVVLDWELNYVKTYLLPHYVWTFLVDDAQKRIVYAPFDGEENAGAVYYFNM